jgi:hypothetical protein
MKWADRCVSTPTRWQQRLDKTAKHRQNWIWPDWA